MPADHLLPDRLDAVLAVVYLIYNEGYGGRVDLAAEAIRLGRVLATLMPDEPEVHGLLALLLIHHSRRRARFDGDELVLLGDQDRSLWDVPEIAAGREMLDRAIALRGRGPYVLQAAIASLQTDEEIDWTGIRAPYEQLAQITGSPVVELNRAVAIAESGSLEQALEIVEQLDLDDYRYMHSTRIRLLPWTLPPMVVAPIVGSLADRYGNRPFMVAGLALQAAGLAWVASIATTGVDYLQLGVAFTIAGIGTSCCFPTVANAIMGSIPIQQAGVASGINSAIRELGGVVGVAVLASVFIHNGGYTNPDAFINGCTPAVWVAVGLSIFGAGAAFLTGTRRRPEQGRRSR